MRDNLVRSALRQNLPVPFLAHARCYTSSFLNSATSISGPKSNFVIRHNFTCTSSNIIYCIYCSSSFAEHLRSVRNNDVDKPVARHFNAANHSISNMKICAISPISGGNDSRKRHENGLIFKIGTIHPHGLNERFSFIWSHLFIVFIFVQQGWTKALTSHLFTPLFMFIHLPLIYFVPLPRLLIDFKNSKWLTYFCILLCIYCFSHLIGLRSVTWLSLLYKFTCFLFIFCFSLTKGQCSKCWTILSVLAVHRPFYISICISTLPMQHTSFMTLKYVSIVGEIKRFVKYRGLWLSGTMSTWIRHERPLPPRIASIQGLGPNWTGFT